MIRQVVLVNHKRVSSFFENTTRIELAQKAPFYLVSKLPHSALFSIFDEQPLVEAVSFFHAGLLRGTSSLAFYEETLGDFFLWHVGGKRLRLGEIQRVFKRFIEPQDMLDLLERRSPELRRLEEAVYEQGETCKPAPREALVDWTQTEPVKKDVAKCLVKDEKRISKYASHFRIGPRHFVASSDSTSELYSFRQPKKPLLVSSGQITGGLLSGKTRFVMVVEPGKVYYWHASKRTLSLEEVHSLELSSDWTENPKEALRVEKEFLKPLKKFSKV